MDDADGRVALECLIRARREDFAGLSRRIGRKPAHIRQYVKRAARPAGRRVR